MRLGVWPGRFRKLARNNSGQTAQGFSRKEVSAKYCALNMSSAPPRQALRGHGILMKRSVKQGVLVTSCPSGALAY
jgi:hypothetical protein